MPCLNLGKRLQPAKRAWKTFTSKLHIKVLHKLNRSRAIKKPTKRFKTTSKRQTTQTTRILRSYHHHRKRLPPVYIDQLFMESTSVVKENLQPPSPGTKAPCEREVREKSLPDTEEARLPYQHPDDVPGTSGEAVESMEGKISAADDMWESLGLASPLMHGINERAEEFIARIRADMQLQEMIARRL